MVSTLIALATVSNLTQAKPGTAFSFPQGWMKSASIFVKNDGSGFTGSGFFYSENKASKISNGFYEIEYKVNAKAVKTVRLIAPSPADEATQEQQNAFSEIVVKSASEIMRRTYNLSDEEIAKRETQRKAFYDKYSSPKFLLRVSCDRLIRFDLTQDGSMAVGWAQKADLSLLQFFWSKTGGFEKLESKSICSPALMNQFEEISVSPNGKWFVGLGEKSYFGPMPL